MDTIKSAFAGLSLILLVTESLSGQTNTFPGSGNVGVGTSAPNEQLEVAGGGRVFIGNGAGATRKGLLIDGVSGGTYVRLHPYNYGTSSSLDLVISPNGGGNVGIGTTTLTSLLQVGSNIGNQGFKVGVVGNMANANAEIRSSLHVITADATTMSEVAASAWNYYNAGTSPSWSGAMLRYYGASTSGTLNGLPAANQGALMFQNVSNGVITSNGANLSIAPAGLISAVFLNNGNVGVGTTNPTQKLSVNGTIQAKEVIVQTGWSDYVFDKDYRLAPLSEVEQHIKREKHLPGIPSAAEVAEHGVSMGEMQSKLLAKIEELTLHQIAQEKRLNVQAARISQLEHENLALQNR